MKECIIDESTQKMVEDAVREKEALKDDFCRIEAAIRAEERSEAEEVASPVDVPDKADTRDTEAVKRIATAYLKLLFPNVRSAQDINPKRFQQYCLRPAASRGLSSLPSGSPKAISVGLFSLPGAFFIGHAFGPLRAGGFLLSPPARFFTGLASGLLRAQGKVLTPPARQKSISAGLFRFLRAFFCPLSGLPQAGKAQRPFPFSKNKPPAFPLLGRKTGGLLSAGQRSVRPL